MIKSEDNLRLVTSLMKRVQLITSNILGTSKQLFNDHRSLMPKVLLQMNGSNSCWCLLSYITNNR